MENVTLSMNHCPRLASGPGTGPADDCGPHWGRAVAPSSVDFSSACRGKIGVLGTNGKRDRGLCVRGTDCHCWGDEGGGSGGPL